MNYMESGSQRPFSIRMDPDVYARLSEGARRRHEPKARTAERLIDEGLRMESHPGVIFREGATGRRAALAGGPDVWEVLSVIRSSGLPGDAGMAQAAKWGNLSLGQVRIAVRYYADFPEEIDERIDLNRRATERERAAWERATAALS